MNRVRALKNDFKTDLAYSELSSEEEFWDAVYRKAFPSMVNHMACLGDTESQRMGIDRVIILANGLTLKVDEKKRRKEYKDILLEFISNDQTRAPGWIEKNLAINYIAYAFMESRRVYLLDWQLLKRTWLRFGEEWKARFEIIRAENKNYTTLSVAVPIGELLTRIRTAVIIDV